jgi:hypothetical protein
MHKRSRFVPSISRKDRIAAYAKEARQKAWHLPPGPERDEMLKRVRRAVAVSQMEDLVRSASATVDDL